MYFNSEIWKRFTEGFGWIVILLAMDLLILHRDNLRQIPPGNIAHDEEMVVGYSASYSRIQKARLQAPCSNHISVENNTTTDYNKAEHSDFTTLNS